MKISFPLNNPRINLIELLNFQMWKIIYDLNTDNCVLDSLFTDNKEQKETLLKLKTDKTKTDV